MNIKKVSEITGVSADTIRYYERIGLIPPVSRNESGIRNFSEQDVNVLEFIRFFRGAGVSVESLIDYIGLVVQGDQTIEARLAILQNEKEDLQARIDGLQKALDRLNHKIDNYRNKVVPREHELFDKENEE
ncbi:MerR family transcriptional regulator [Streptococcus bovimastitidis]|uniref:MerR family transcriptional regulator n=1 Tax=Streptococcus bovimastitidis TaxID=1856638 RepID=A0A1L8MNF3_9STRE|nr:stress response transcriptional regulator NmlR [Streptococcus bovimastitidis]OJF72300.1 MerR family transcriptional regulator [Streptococcus bovimastitidis]